MNVGKLEARYTLDSDVDISAEDSGGTFTATIPSGEYYLSSPGDGSNGLADEVQAQLNSSGTDTWTVSVSAGEGGTGKTTISADGTTAEVTWGNLDAEKIRDALGFSGTLTGSTSYTSSGHIRGLWLPGSGTAPQHLNAASGWTGWEEDHAAVNEGPDGIVTSVELGEKTVNELRWFGVPKKRTWSVQESLSNESFQTFRKDFIRGDGPHIKPGSPIRWYADADDDATHATYKAAQLRQFRPEPLAEGYTGHWIIETGRLVVDPNA